MQTDLFARVRRPCTGPYGCGRRVQTLAYVQRPVCRACRRRLANLRRTEAHRTRQRWDTYDARAAYWRARYHATKERTG